MKIRLLPLLAASVLLVSSFGCGKPAAKDATNSSEQTFNAVQLFQDFESAPPELSALADKAWKAVQCGSFAEGLKYLNQLAANPALNDAQKKSVAALAERVKAQMTANAAVR